MNTSQAPFKRSPTLPDFRTVRGIILDAVGTLITPKPSVSRTYVDAAARQGVAIDVEIMRRRFRTSFAQDEAGEVHGPLATSEALERRRWQRIVAQCLPEVPDPNRAFAELWDHFANPHSWIVYDDVPELLDTLHARDLPCLIASNFDARLRTVLHGLPPLRHLADSAVISSQVGHRKPDPRFFEAACTALQLPPHSVLHVGDDPLNDRDGPRRAGLLAFRIDRHNPDPGDDDLPSLADLNARFTSG